MNKQEKTKDEEGIALMLLKQLKRKKGIKRRSEILEKELKATGYYEGKFIMLCYDGETLHVARPAFPTPPPPIHPACRCSLIP